MSTEAREQFQEDLVTFGEQLGVKAKLHCPEGISANASVVLYGMTEVVSVARRHVDDLLARHYLEVGGAKKKRPAEAVEQLEVAGMKMQSMPARNRRRRVVQDDAEEAGATPKEPQQAKDLDRGHRKNEAVAADTAAEARAASEELRQFEYLDHTADIILHSWGTSLKQAIEQNCVAFFAYMTDLDRVDLGLMVEVEASGRDILDLMFHLHDEFLFSFMSDSVMCRRIEIIELDLSNFRIRARGYGEKFDLSKHTQGTEIKAITMHQLKVLTPETLSSEGGVVPRPPDSTRSGEEGDITREGFPYEVYVLVDI